MENVRLIYEQIEEAKKLLLGGSVLHLRLSLILLDNAVELMMHRELEYEFGWYDHWRPKSQPALDVWLKAGLGPKYTEEERKGAERARSREFCRLRHPRTRESTQRAHGGAAHKYTSCCESSKQ